MHKEGECAASECSQVCTDFMRTGFTNFVVDPSVRQVRLLAPAASLETHVSGSTAPCEQISPAAALQHWARGCSSTYLWLSPAAGVLGRDTCILGPGLQPRLHSRLLPAHSTALNGADSPCELSPWASRHLLY